MISPCRPHRRWWKGTSFSFKGVDSQIKFGELAEGTYTYMVMLTDSNGETLCFTSDFTVSDGSSSTATYWSAQDTEGTKLSDGIQQIETTLTDAARNDDGLAHQPVRLKMQTKRPGM